MAVKRARRSVPRISYQKFLLDGVTEFDKNLRRSGRLSGIDLNKSSSPEISQKNRNSSLYEKDPCAMAVVRKQVKSSTLVSSNKNSKIEQKKIFKNKLGQAPSFSSSETSMDRKRSLKGYKESKKHSAKFKKSSSLSSLEASIITRSQRKSLDLIIKLNEKSENTCPEICPLNKVTDLPKDSKRKRYSYGDGILDQKILGVQKTPLLTQTISVDPIIDCLTLKHSRGKVKGKRVLSQEKFKNRSPKDANLCSEMRKGKYHLRSLSEKTSNPLKPVLQRKQRVASLPIDDLVYTASKTILKKNCKEICGPKPVSKHTPAEHKDKNVSKVLKVSKKRSMKAKKSKSLPKTATLPKIQTSSTGSKLHMKRKRNINNYSENINSNSVNGRVGSSISTVKNLDTNISLCSENIDKKSKRHTFPMHSPNEIQTSIDSKLHMKRKRNTNNYSENMNSNSVNGRTRSSISTVKNLDTNISLCSENIDKKSKRHTFPMHSSNGKYYVSSQSHQRKQVKACNEKLNSVSAWNLSAINHKNVPLDDLIKPQNSSCTSVRLSRTMFVSSTPIKHISEKRPVQDKSGVPSKSKNATQLGKAKQTGKSVEKSGLALPNSIPGRGTLKRKRWIYNTLKERNDGYEDDLFESMKFDKMKAALEISDDESDTSGNSIATPKCGFILTPSLPKRTPMFKDCISSKELLEARKNAEQYFYRRNKKWRSENRNDTETLNSSTMAGTSAESEIDMPEKKKLDYSTVLANVIAQQKSIEKLTQDESEEEDAYFSDVSG